MVCDNYYITIKTRDANHHMGWYHNHDSYEIMLVTEGVMRACVTDKVYEVKKGEAILTKPGVYHYSKSLGGYTRIVTEFSEEYLASAFTPVARERLLRCFDREKIILNKEELRIIEDVAQKSIQYNSDSSDGFLYLGRILNIMNKSLEHNNAPEKIHKVSGSAEKINNITNYIAMNFKNVGTTDEIAEACYISKSHMCRLFKDALGISVSDYVLTMRMRFAEKLLRNTEMSVIDISLECGFGSSQYFSRLFRKAHGCSPGEYRKR